jgi:two-component system chemotaxis response regulator CheB
VEREKREAAVNRNNPPSGRQTNVLRDIVVIGASAGGVQALLALVADLPADLPAAVFITHHFPSGGHSVLPALLGRAGKLPTSWAEDGTEVQPGTIYIGPPDFHLLVEHGRIQLSSGPKENGHRPSIDVLFRSAAKAGNRVVGVILSGMLDDGAAGLLTIKSRGGFAIVQDPSDASYSSMPEAAIRRVAIDRVVPIAAMAAAISEAVNGSKSSGAEMDEQSAELIKKEMEVGNPPVPIDEPSEVPGELTMYTCPECHGTLWELREDKILRYRCHVGHSYTEDTFVSQKTAELESALWTALRSLQEHAAIMKRMQEQAERHGHCHTAKRMADNHIEAQRRADVVREVLLNSPIFRIPAVES